MKRFSALIPVTLCALTCLAIPSLPAEFGLPSAGTLDLGFPEAKPLEKTALKSITLTGKAAWLSILSQAESGVAEMQYAAGNVYRMGFAGVVPSDPVKAFGWYGKAAAQNHTGSILNLGRCYYDGLGTAQDYRQAFLWFKKGAALKEARCMNNVGQMCLNGTGTEQDRYEAYGWFAAAIGADPELVLPYLNLALCHHNGWGVDQDMSKAYPLFCYAAAHGNTEAQIHLIHYNMEGLGGLAKEPLKAYAWALVAKRLGHPSASKYTDFFERHLKKDAQKKAQAEAAKWEPAKP